MLHYLDDRPFFVYAEVNSLRDYPRVNLKISGVFINLLARFTGFRKVFLSAFLIATFCNLKLSTLRLFHSGITKQVHLMLISDIWANKQVTFPSFEQLDSMLIIPEVILGAPPCCEFLSALAFMEMRIDIEMH